MASLLGYARVSTGAQDLALQHDVAQRRRLPANLNKDPVALLVEYGFPYVVLERGNGSSVNREDREAISVDEMLVMCGSWYLCDA